MKRFFIFFIILAELALLMPVAQAKYTPGEKRKFLVTGYYSPLPDQDFYVRGSLEADIKLNGRGTNGADGTEVFTGMLAAPKTYPFGTRIRIPGLGVGEVRDRGGAIIATADYDRIDVWMGHGEEGLARAINWGARMVEGEVWENPHQAEPGFSLHTVSAELSPELITRLKQRTSLPVTEASPLSPVLEISPEEKARREVILKEQGRLRDYQIALAAGLGKNVTGKEVEALQLLLWELGYYHGPVSRTYDTETIDAVFTFQQDYGILQTAYEPGAGYYGNQTHKALVAAVDQRIELVPEYPKEMQTWIPAKRELPKLGDLSPVTDVPPFPSLRFDIGFLSDDHSPFSENLRLNDHGEAVKILQEILIREGYLADKLNTGYYGLKTQAAVTEFQLQEGVIAFASEPGAGQVGPKTRVVLNAL